MSQACEAAPEAVRRSAFVVPAAGGAAATLWITVGGDLPDPCWSVQISKSNLAIWPPEFALEACRTGGFCPSVVTPYDVVASFMVGTAPETIALHDVSGRHEVTVEVVPDHARGAPAGGDEPAAIGRSVGRADVGEALSDAAAQLDRGDHPNVPRNVRAKEIWYQEGGVLPPVLYVRASKRAG